MSSEIDYHSIVFFHKSFIVTKQDKIKVYHIDQKTTLVRQIISVENTYNYNQYVKPYFFIFQHEADLYFFNMKGKCVHCSRTSLEKLTLTSLKNQMIFTENNQVRVFSRGFKKQLLNETRIQKHPDFYIYSIMARNKQNLWSYKNTLE